jgi:hypothetical protein
MATQTRYATVSDALTAPTDGVSWAGVGGTLAQAVSESGSSSEPYAQVDIDALHEFSYRIQSKGFAFSIPFFSTITAFSTSRFASKTNILDDVSISGIGTLQTRVYSVGSTYSDAGTGTSGGLRSSVANSLTVTPTEYVKATWQASGVTNYFGSGSSGQGVNRANSSSLAVEEAVFWTQDVDVEAGAQYYKVSGTFTFTPPGAPGAFTLLGPADDATDVSLTPTLTWNAASNAVQYRVRVSPNSDMSAPVVDETTDPITDNTATAGTSFDVPAAALENGTEYFWRVTAINYATTATTGEQTTDCTADFSFTTEAAGSSRLGSLRGRSSFRSRRLG